MLKPFCTVHFFVHLPTDKNLKLLFSLWSREDRVDEYHAYYRYITYFTALLPYLAFNLS